MQATLEQKAETEWKPKLTEVRQTNYNELDLHERAQLNKRLRYSTSRTYKAN